MNNFVKGILVGVGIGILIAPFKGEETRRIMGDRLTELRNSLPENEQINQYVQQVSDRVSQTGDNLRDYARQAVSKVKDTGASLGNLAQQSVEEVKHTGQEVVGKTKEATNSVRSGSTTKNIAESTNTSVLE